jgi:hypothetical protein
MRRKISGFGTLSFAWHGPTMISTSYNDPDVCYACRRQCPQIFYEINNHFYHKGYYLADGITLHGNLGEDKLREPSA